MCFEHKKLKAADRIARRQRRAGARAPPAGLDFPYRVRHARRSLHCGIADPMFVRSTLDRGFAEIEVGISEERPSSGLYGGSE